MDSGDGGFDIADVLDASDGGLHGASFERAPRRLELAALRGGRGSGLAGAAGGGDFLGGGGPPSPDDMSRSPLSPLPSAPLLSAREAVDGALAGSVARAAAGAGANLSRFCLALQSARSREEVAAAVADHAPRVLSASSVRLFALEPRSGGGGGGGGGARGGGDGSSEEGSGTPMRSYDAPRSPSETLCGLDEGGVAVMTDAEAVDAYYRAVRRQGGAGAARGGGAGVAAVALARLEGAARGPPDFIEALYFAEERDGGWGAGGGGGAAGAAAHPDALSQLRAVARHAAFALRSARELGAAVAECERARASALAATDAAATDAAAAARDTAGASRMLAALASAPAGGRGALSGFMALLARELPPLLGAASVALLVLEDEGAAAAAGGARGARRRRSARGASPALRGGGGGDGGMHNRMGGGSDADGGSESGQSSVGAARRPEAPHAGARLLQVRATCGDMHAGARGFDLDMQSTSARA